MDMVVTKAWAAKRSADAKTVEQHFAQRGIRYLLLGIDSDDSKQGACVVVGLARHGEGRSEVESHVRCRVVERADNPYAELLDPNTFVAQDDRIVMICGIRAAGCLSGTGGGFGKL